MSVIYNENHNRNSTNGPYNNYNGYISIKVRGNTSKSFSKKQYKIETIFPDNSNNNVSLMGLPKENDWVLYAPYIDKTLIRNVFTYDLATKMGHYAPRSRFCELILNDEYMGVYVLMEKIKRDKNRVNISKLDKTNINGLDVTGGYLLQIDRPDSNEFYWKTPIKNINVQCEYPKTEDLVPEQKAYITKLINNFEAALYSDNYQDSVSGYRQYIDLESFVDYFIINELSKNIDAYRLSTYMHKDRDDIDGRLKMGPVWDYNLAYGGADYNEGYISEGFVASCTRWWNRIITDPIFNQALKERWTELRYNELTLTKINYHIDSLTTIIDEAKDRNFEKWDILGEKLWSNYYVGQNYNDEIDYLANWFSERIKWLDQTIVGNDLTDNEIAINIQACPVPFSTNLTLNISLAVSSIVSIDIYNASGKKVNTIINNIPFEAGLHQIDWDASGLNTAMSNNIYIVLYRVNGKIISTQKIFRQ